MFFQMTLNTAHTPALPVFILDTASNIFTPCSTNTSSAFTANELYKLLTWLQSQS